jgi:hypothetical protein
MDCVNLKQPFGKQYRVCYEESYYAQYGPRARTDDPWLQIIPCRYGHIYPHGGDLLAASTNKAGLTARRLKALAGVTVHQDGDDGVTVLFPIEMFPAVAALMHPKRRRKPLTEAQLEVLAKGRVLSPIFTHSLMENDAQTARGCVPATQVGLGAIGGYPAENRGDGRGSPGALGVRTAALRSQNSTPRW